MHFIIYIILFTN